MDRAPAAGGSRLHRQHFLVLLILAVSGATLLIGYLLWSARRDALQAAQVTALNYARTLEVRLDATFRRADSILLGLSRSTPREALLAGAGPEHAETLNRALDTMMSGFEELIALRIVDANGDQRYVSDAVHAPPVNYADRSFFRTYRADPSADLLFSEVVQGRVALRPTMVITRPLRDGAGRLHGAVLAPMDLSFFQQQFRKLDIGRNGVVFLRRAEAGELVLRWPQIDAEVNRPMPPDQPILRAVRQGHNESVNEYTAFTDGVRRISGTVVVKGYPFFLTVALSSDDILASWRRQALLTGLTWALLLALMAVLLRRLWRLDRERGSLEAQLRESRRIESLGTLAGGIAHDFNNIVAAILGNVALARKELGADHPAQRSLEQIRTAGSRARDLVQQILAFGRRQPHALLNQPLQPLVEEALALLRSTLPEGVELRAELPAQPVHARVDATQMQQVLINLCNNGWHALQGRPGRLTVGLEACTLAAGLKLVGHPLAPGRYARLWVADTGHGMDAATLERVFEPFFTTKPTGEGTGLGLPVVHGIVLAHGGAIRIESTPGQGTTVHLYFPLVDPAEAPAAAERRDEVAAAPQGSGQRVIYVDDDEVLVLLVERLLGQAGYRVRSFRDGREAVAAVRADPQSVDLVVTDYNMPGYDGLDVARAMAAARADLPVVISSGYISDELQDQAAAAGVRALLRKQHLLEDLLRVVDEALSG